MADHWRTQHRRDLLAVLWRLPLVFAAAATLALLVLAALWSLLDGRTHDAYPS